MPRFHLYAFRFIIEEIQNLLLLAWQEHDLYTPRTAIDRFNYLNVIVCLEELEFFVTYIFEILNNIHS